MGSFDAALGEGPSEPVNPFTSEDSMIKLKFCKFK